jgi:hypothetical protein
MNGKPCHYAIVRVRSDSTDSGWSTVSLDKALTLRVAERLGGLHLMRQLVREFARDPLPEGSTRSRYCARKLLEHLMQPKEAQ